MKKKIKINPEYLKKPQKENTWLDYVHADNNNLSFWYPKVKDCGFLTPKTIIIPHTEEIIKALFMEDPGDKERITAFVEKNIMPAIKKIGGLPFIKNGSFSNKFQFNLCCPASADLDTIIHSIIQINYDAMCFGAGGENETVIRERIPAAEDYPAIYQGMPLRPEFRVFYDFSLKRVIYIQNYWDWDYCYEAIARHPEDGNVFALNYGKIHDIYKNAVRKLWQQAEEKLKKTEGLNGIWSVDFLLDDNTQFWLIDMAEGYKSAYFQMHKCILSVIYPKIENYFHSVGFMPEEKEKRIKEYEEYCCSLNKTFDMEIISSFMEAYQRNNSLGPKRYPDAVVDGKYDPFLAFLIKHHPNSTEKELQEALKYYRMGFGKEEKEPRTKNWAREIWGTMAKTLFAFSVNEFLKNQ